MVMSELLFSALIVTAMSVPTGSEAVAIGAPAPPPVSDAHPSPGVGVGTACVDSAQVLDLANWKLTLPVSAPATPDNRCRLSQPALATYPSSLWFHPTPACDGVLLRAPVNGATTTNSKNPRSELREMTDNGAKPASWSATNGTHTLVVTEAFTHLPQVKPQLVGTQIHDATHDITVFRLEGPDLYITNDNNTHYKLVTSNYRLGTRFEAKYVVSGGRIRAYYNNTPQTTIPAPSLAGAYFKAGAYTQANCINSSPCSEDRPCIVALGRGSAVPVVTSSWHDSANDTGCRGHHRHGGACSTSNAH